MTRRLTTATCSTCSTCAHWHELADSEKWQKPEPNSDMRSGWCVSPYIDEMPELEGGAYLAYSYQEGGSFMSGPNFGCVHHKERT